MVKFEFAIVAIRSNGNPDGDSQCDIVSVNMTAEEAIHAVANRFVNTEVEVNERKYIFRSDGTSVNGTSPGELAMAVLRAAESKAVRGPREGTG